MTTTYDPNQVVLVIGSVPIVGFADGTSITLPPNADLYSQTNGTNGAYIRSRGLDRSAVLTFTLLPNSPSNAVLNEMVLSDVLNNAGIRNFYISSRHALTPSIVSGEGWVNRFFDPNLSIGGDAGLHEWVIHVARYTSKASSGAPLTGAL
jgi:hypothetical protein